MQQHYAKIYFPGTSLLYNGGLSSYGREFVLAFMSNWDATEDLVDVLITITTLCDCIIYVNISVPLMQVQVIFCFWSIQKYVQSEQCSDFQRTIHQTQKS